MMECANAKRKDGYYVLTRVYIPTGEYHLEPQYIKDVTSKHECSCSKCKQEIVSGKTYTDIH